MRGDTEGKEGKPRSPKNAAEQVSPEPERPLNTQEERGQSIQELDQPPQAEGGRDDAEDSLRRGTKDE